ncbi:MAG: hypothetical protein ACAI38_03900 [Myxococcota bacterium]|nr:hypothetical protein [Myxococcota bacterium]
MKNATLSSYARQVVASVKAAAAQNRRGIEDGASAHDGAFSLTFAGFNRKSDAEAAGKEIKRLRNYDAYVVNEGHRAWALVVNH